MPAKQTFYKCNRPRVCKVLPLPPDIDLCTVAEKCRYVGSPYHRTIPVKGQTPVRRPDKAACPRELQKNQSLVREWLKNAILRGNFGEFKQGFPRVVWHEEDGRLFEARQSGHGSCEYHGFPLASHDTIIGMK